MSFRVLLIDIHTGKYISIFRASELPVMLLELAAVYDLYGAVVDMARLITLKAFVLVILFFDMA